MQHRRNAFSLIELVITVVIIGIIGAIALPRMSRGAAGAADAALVQNLSVLRSAIELYTTEHQGLMPEKDSTLADQLTMFTDIDGDTSATKTATHVYGPYLHAMPALPVGENKGSTDIRDGGNPGDGDDGWFYNKDTGQINANTEDAEVDTRGIAYNTY